MTAAKAVRITIMATLFVIGWIAAIGVGIAFYSASANADADPPRASDTISSVNGCLKHEICSAQTATGDCTVLPASGDERVLRVLGYSRFALYGLQSVGDYVCDVMSNDEGHDAAVGVGQKINVTSLTETTDLIQFEGTYDYIWVTCPTIATSVTVNIVSCPASR